MFVSRDFKQPYNSRGKGYIRRYSKMLTSCHKEPKVSLTKACYGTKEDCVLLSVKGNTDKSEAVVNVELTRSDVVNAAKELGIL